MEERKSPGRENIQDSVRISYHPRSRINLQEYSNLLDTHMHEQTKGKKPRSLLIKFKKKIYKKSNRRTVYKKITKNGREYKKPQEDVWKDVADKTRMTRYKNIYES